VNIRNPRWLVLLMSCMIAASLALASAQDERALRLADLSDGVPSAQDGFNNGIGFVTWQDGGGALTLSAVAIEPGDAFALPDQLEVEHALRIDHRIASWGGVTQAFADAELRTWVSVDLSSYEGLRFWFAGTGSGGSIQIDLFDNRNPNLTGDSAERWFHRFVDNTTDWRLIEIPFRSFARRTDFQPSGAPDDGLGLDQASGWAIGFPPGEGTSYVARVEAYGDSGVVREGVVTVAFAEPLTVVDEGETAELRVVLSEASADAVSVRVFVRGDEAEPFRDFVPVNELLVFPPGVTEVIVPVRTLLDGRHEGDERAQALLDGPRGAVLGFQRRAVLLIRDVDPFDPDLLAEFGDSVAPLVAGPGTEVRRVELLGDAANARPGQGRFEGVARLDWEERGQAAIRFDLAQDASHADGVEFWYAGDGSGRRVTVRVLDGSDPEQPMALVWSDEFDGPAGTLPDPSVWLPEIGDGTANGIPGWGNAERQTYTDDPANVSLDGDGHLVIRALETGGDAPPCYYGAPCEYTSARIITQGTLELTYGRIEARIALPYGQGVWPAFWTLGSNIAEVGWPESGEIDIMEHIGREPSTVHGTIHGPGYSGGGGIGRSVTLPDGATFAGTFHVFAIDWEPGRITWLLDGVPYSTLTPADLPPGRNWVFDAPHFLILNLAIGGLWPGYPDDTTVFPQTMLVDYVRVYQRADTAARYEASFVDEGAGWTLVRLPFSALERASEQPAGAPERPFERAEVWGLEFAIDGGSGTALLDEVRWYQDR